MRKKGAHLVDESDSRIKTSEFLTFGVINTYLFFCSKLTRFKINSFQN